MYPVSTRPHCFSRYSVQCRFSANILYVRIPNCDIFCHVAMQKWPINQHLFSFYLAIRILQIISLTYVGTRVMATGTGLLLINRCFVIVNSMYTSVRSMKGWRSLMWVPNNGALEQHLSVIKRLVMANSIHFSHNSKSLFGRRIWFPFIHISYINIQLPSKYLQWITKIRSMTHN